MSRSRAIALTVLLGTAASLGCGDDTLAGAGTSARRESEQTGALAEAPARTRQNALQAAVRVRVARVRVGRVARGEDLSGVVHAFHKATITAETSGRIVERRVERGDVVEARSPLLLLDASRLELDLARGEATVAARKTDLGHAQRELERGQKLVAQDAISDQSHDDLRYAVERAQNELALARVARDTARRTLEDATIRAPFSGVVEDISVDVGDHVMAGSPVVTLVELSRVRLRAGVTASQAGALSPGSLAQASFTQLDGKPLAAELKSVGLVADPASGTYELEFWLENPDRRLREGMVASLRLTDPDREALPLVPRAALIRGEDGMAVFVVEGPDDEPIARVRPVRLGRREGDVIEIVSGLSEGERVVVDGHFALSDGTAVAVDDVALANAP